MFIRSFSNSIQAEALKPSIPSHSAPPQPFHTSHDPSATSTPPIQLATSPGPPPPLYPPPTSSADIPSFSPSPAPTHSNALSHAPLPAQAPHNAESTNAEGVSPLIIKSSLRSGQQVGANICYYLFFFLTLFPLRLGLRAQRRRSYCNGKRTLWRWGKIFLLHFFFVLFFLIISDINSLNWFFI